jgi:hypothetical protein
MKIRLCLNNYLYTLLLYSMSPFVIQMVSSSLNSSLEKNKFHFSAFTILYEWKYGFLYAWKHGFLVYLLNHLSVVINILPRTNPAPSSQFVLLRPFGSFHVKSSRKIKVTPTITAFDETCHVSSFHVDMKQCESISSSFVSTTLWSFGETAVYLWPRPLWAIVLPEEINSLSLISHPILMKFCNFIEETMKISEINWVLSSGLSQLSHALMFHRIWQSFMLKTRLYETSIIDWRQYVTLAIFSW